jgi:branched-chain amino acid transport system permease protein
VAHMWPSVFGGEGGMGIDRAANSVQGAWSWGPVSHLAVLMAAYTVVCVGLMRAWTFTPLGRLLNAVRDNPLRAASVGVDPRRVRHIAFVVSAGFAGVAGGLSALWFEMVSPEVFSTHRSGAYLLFAFVGGSAYLAGPLIGAVLMVLALVVWSSWTPAWLLYMGLLFVWLVVVAPGGLAAGLERSARVALAWRWPASPQAWSSLAWRALAAVGWALVLAAFAIGVEMVYFWQLSSTWGTVMTWWSGSNWAWSVDVAQARTWWAVLGVGVLGGVSVAWARVRATPSPAGGPA